uniref:Oxidoreductase domain protein n=1 Tax=uncultured bacterium contig00049 TaxID=1181534 RepID=A0A806KKL8_9BACT|nr:oxidoreductase domain protein [uncultured bacterium contig00049]
MFKSAEKRLKYGMVGGGQGAFIGDVHRKSIALDDLAVIKAGCFSRSAENSLETGCLLGIEPERCYKTYQEMAESESKHPEKIDFVVIVTPNNTHYAIAKAFLNAGIHVACDKPLVWEVEQAQELADLAKKNGLLFCVTYSYTGYPAVKQVREMLREGEIGAIRFVNAEYPQEWLATPVEKGDHKQAKWRVDPAISGKTNCVGDIGSHVENMVSYMTGLRIKSLCARLDKIVEGRALDDNAVIMVEYDKGAKGLYWSSQIAVGYDNGLRVRIFGEKGTIQWTQEEPNYIDVFKLGQPNQRWSRGRNRFYPHAQGYSRIPAGHPEGYFEALANIYKTYIGAVSKLKAGQSPSAEDLDFPDARSGLDGVIFINKCVESSDNGAVWVKII